MRLPTLADPEAVEIRAVSVLNSQSSYGGLPHPIISAIDNKSVVKLRFSRSVYTSRPEIASVLNALQ